jgi:hypothetical protein
MNNKKAMGIAQVFIFIVAAITFAIIAIFGYKMVTDFIDKGEQVEFIQFKTELESSVKKIYTEFGAVRTKTFHTPLQYEQICFVDLDTAYPTGTGCTFDAYGCDVWQDAWQDAEGSSEQGFIASDENVFLIPPAPAKIKVYRLEIEGEIGFFCTNITLGRFTLRLEGLGDKTKIINVRDQGES